LPLPLVVAWRYLRGRRSRLLQRTAVAALLSIALGVMAMVIAMALMTGYREDLERKLIAGNAAVLAYPLGPPGKKAPPELTDRLRRLPGITAVGQVAYGQGTLISARRPEGEAVTLRGVPAGRDALAGQAPGLGADGVPRAIVGAELAARLAVGPGDVVRLVALGFARGAPRFRYESLRVAGTFRTGFAEFDRNWVVLPRPLVEQLAGGAGGSTLFEIAIADPSRAPEIARRVEKLLGADYLVTDWQRLNRELFSALRLQQLLLFFLLGLIVLVSTFNVASTLMVLVRERLRDVGVLAALGMSRRRLAAVFVLYGGALGLLGTLLGVALGSVVAFICDRFRLIRFDPEVAAIYFVSAVPFRVEARDLLAITVFSVAFTLLSCLLPTVRVVRVRASDALRYE
jgi:lipoprotein-releasing system permease protein